MLLQDLEDPLKVGVVLRCRLGLARIKQGLPLDRRVAIGLIGIILQRTGRQREGATVLHPHILHRVVAGMDEQGAHAGAGPDDLQGLGRGHREVIVENSLVTGRRGLRFGETVIGRDGNSGHEALQASMRVECTPD